MREIIFRGKTKNRKDNVWIEGSLVRGVSRYEEESVFFIYDLTTEIDGRGWIDNYDGEEVDPKTVGQFTGLFDKNGRNIFEGDIVRCQYSYRNVLSEYYIVRWEDGSCGFEPFSDSLENCGCRGGGLESKNCDVIGNIHDNPDLMKDNDTAYIDRMEEYLKTRAVNKEVV